MDFSSDTLSRHMEGGAWLVSTKPNLELLLSAAKIGTLLLLLLSIPLHIIYNLFLHPLSTYPGPLHRTTTRLPYVCVLFRGDHHAVVKALHDTYGPVVRIAPDALSFISAEAWRDIYGHRRQHEPEMAKSPEFYVGDPGAPSLVYSSRADHARFRRLLSHGFSDGALRRQEPLLRHYVDLLIQRMRDAAATSSSSSDDDKNTVDIVELLSHALFDAIGDLTYGASFSCLNTSISHPWLSALFGALKDLVWLRAAQYVPLIGGRHLSKLLWIILPRGIVERRRAHYRHTRAMMERRVAITEERHDFMEAVIRLSKEEGEKQGDDDNAAGRGMSFAEMVSNSALLMLAGTETTSSLLAGVVFLLLRNGKKMERLVEEVGGAFADEGEITIEGTARLPYLNAVLEECLRLYPPVAIGLPRVVPPGGGIIEGKFVPAGTTVSVDHLAAYHSALNFAHPDSFVPERWLPDPPAPYVDDKRAALQPFSYGPRNCIGRNLAYAESRLILSRIVYNFDLRLSELNGEKNKTWLDQLSYAVWEKPPLFVHVVNKRVGKA